MKFKLPVTWEVFGMVEVEADSLQQAFDDFDPDAHSLPLENDYVDGSFRLSVDNAEEAECYQEPPKTDKTIEDFGIGVMVNVKADPRDDVFSSFTGRVVSHNKGFVQVKNEETDEVWDTEPKQLSYNSDEYVHD